MCTYKQALKGNGKCNLNFPDCQNDRICYYKEKYDDLMSDARAVRQEQIEEYGYDLYE